MNGEAGLIDEVVEAHADGDAENEAHELAFDRLGDGGCANSCQQDERVLAAEDGPRRLVGEEGVDGEQRQGVNREEDQKRLPRGVLHVIADEGVDHAHQGQQADHGLAPDDGVFPVEDEGDVVVPRFFVAAALGALEIVQVGQGAVLHRFPVLEEAGVEGDAGENGRHEHPQPRLGGAPLATAHAETSLLRCEISDDEFCHHDPRDSGHHIDHKGLLRRMLHAERHAGCDQPDRAAALRPAPHGGDAQRDQQYQRHLHDEVPCVVHLHRRHGHEEHRVAGRESAQGVSQQQGGEQQQQAADDRHLAQAGLRPVQHISPAGQF